MTGNKKRRTGKGEGGKYLSLFFFIAVEKDATLFVPFTMSRLLLEKRKVGRFVHELHLKTNLDIKYEMITAI